MADDYAPVVRQRLPLNQEPPGGSFAGVDVRGMNFRGRDLTGANFRGARAGISSAWSAGFMAAFLLLSFVAGALLGVSAAVYAIILFPAPDEVGPAQPITLLLAVTLLVLLLLLLLWRGLDASVVGLAVLAAISIFLLILFGPELTGPFAVLVLGFAGLLGGSVLLGVAVAACRSLAAGRGRLLLLAIVALLSALGTAAALWETIVGFREQSALEPFIVGGLAAAAALSLFFAAATFYIAHRSMTGDPRFKLIRRMVVAILSRRSTNFRNANLTGADFAGAYLGYADLRGANLLRTNWQGARDLDRAYVTATYLGDDRLCRLVTDKRGAGQVFDELDMEGLNLEGADLASASFIGANLSQASLTGANLQGAKLVRTQLYDTDLSAADLTGAYIEHWGVSTHTHFDGVHCAYVYMHLPTEADPDPMRKPDDKGEFFAEGDFSDFIAPIIRTLEYYHDQNTDPRAVTKAAKTLDLVQRQDENQEIDPDLSALAVHELAQRHPEADMQVVLLKAKDGDKVQIRTVVSDAASAAQRSRMSEEFRAIYAAMLALPNPRREQLRRNIVEKDTQIQQLRSMVLAAINNQTFYVETNIRPATRIKCLLVAANPLNHADLRLDVEQRAILKQLRASEYRDVFELIPVPAAQPDDLMQALNEHKPKVVQFSGHGDRSGQLIFMDEKGYAAPITTAALGLLFTALKDNIRLVILNACYSEEQAQSINKEIDCVVGMNDAISDDAAIAFIAAFYRALGFGRSIRNAFDQALVSIGLLGTHEETIPQLLTRQGVDATQVVLVAPDVLAEKDMQQVAKETDNEGHRAVA